MVEKGGETSSIGRQTQIQIQTLISLPSHTDFTYCWDVQRFHFVCLNLQISYTYKSVCGRVTCTHTKPLKTEHYHHAYPYKIMQSVLDTPTIYHRAHCARVRDRVRVWDVQW